MTNATRIQIIESLVDELRAKGNLIARAHGEGDAGAALALISQSILRLCELNGQLAALRHDLGRRHGEGTAAR